MVSVIERFANSVKGDSVRLLLLGDNLGVVLAFRRCRARCYGLLSQVRSSWASALTRDLKIPYHWSVLNSTRQISVAAFFFTTEKPNDSVTATSDQYPPPPSLERSTWGIKLVWLRMFSFSFPFSSLPFFPVSSLFAPPRLQRLDIFPPWLANLGFSPLGLPTWDYSPRVD